LNEPLNNLARESVSRKNKKIWEYIVGDTMAERNLKTIFLKVCLLLGAVAFSSILVLSLDLVARFSFFKDLVKIVQSAFDVNPASQPGSNLRVCTVGVTVPAPCTNARQALFSWNVQQGSQVAFALQVDNNGWLPRVPSTSFPSPEVDTGEIGPSASNQYALTTSEASNLSWDTIYFWQIAVKDNFGSWSGWTEADASFRTYRHAWPAVDFFWSLFSPSQGETVQFTDQTQVFGGATKQSWNWTIPDATYVGGTNSNSQNPTVEFNSTGPKTISLRVFDSDGYNCSVTYSNAFNVRLPLPGWEETAP